MNEFKVSFRRMSYVIKLDMTTPFYFILLRYKKISKNRFYDFDIGQFGLEFGAF